MREERLQSAVLCDVKSPSVHSQSLTLLQLRGEQVGSHCSRQTPPCSVQG